MKIFTTTKHLSSEHFSFDRKRKSHSRTSSTARQSYYKNSVTPLAHTMHLFEEKNRYPPLPFTGPLAIKANGAIVVHRPNNHPIDAMRSLSVYLHDEDEDYDDEHFIINTYTENDPVVNTNDLERVKDNGSTSTTEKDEQMNLVQVVHEENRRLRRQILFEREQHEQSRASQEELVSAKLAIFNLQRRTDRLEKLLALSMMSGRQSDQAAVKNARRQSTGAYNHTTGVLQMSPPVSEVSYEQKIQILLDEIEAMQQDEVEELKKLTVQSNARESLVRELVHKDDIIKQLTYDLQLEKYRR
ncbi:MAG: hypothetical protein EXX96DRAFT_605854 [Benjaminiella poitrasii]|nr:MAG: hypothetical protein EXX96DRAFT_605854 [Benjaminiella poitrasii]